MNVPILEAIYVSSYNHIEKWEMAIKEFEQTTVYELVKEQEFSTHYEYIPDHQVHMYTLWLNTSNNKAEFWLRLLGEQTIEAMNSEYPKNSVRVYEQSR